MATIDLQSLLSRGNDARYQTELLRDVSAGETSMPVLTTAGHPDVGAIVVDNEKISYTSRTATTFDGCTRGDDQDNGFAPPTAHAGGAVVKQANRPNYETVVANAF